MISLTNMAECLHHATDSARSKSRRVRIIQLAVVLGLCVQTGSCSGVSGYFGAVQNYACETWQALFGSPASTPTYNSNTKPCECHFGTEYANSGKALPVKKLVRGADGEGLYCAMCDGTGEIRFTFDQDTADSHKWHYKNNAFEDDSGNLGKWMPFDTDEACCMIETQWQKLDGGFTVCTDCAGTGNKKDAAIPITCESCGGWGDNGYVGVLNGGQEYIINVHPKQMSTQRIGSTKVSEHNIKRIPCRSPKNPDSIIGEPLPCGNLAPGSRVVSCEK